MWYHYQLRQDQPSSLSFFRKFSNIALWFILTRVSICFLSHMAYPSHIFPISIRISIGWREVCVYLGSSWVLTDWLTVLCSARHQLHLFSELKTCTGPTERTVYYFDLVLFFFLPLLVFCLLQVNFVCPINGKLISLFCYKLLCIFLFHLCSYSLFWLTLFYACCISVGFLLPFYFFSLFIYLFSLAIPSLKFKTLFLSVRYFLLVLFFLEILIVCVSLFVFPVFSGGRVPCVS